MLCLNLRAGDAIAAHQSFTLRLAGFDDSGWPLFDVETLHHEHFGVTLSGGTVVAYVADPGKPVTVRCNWHSRIRLAGCRITVERFRAERVKLAIEAPTHIRINRITGATK